MKNQSLRRKAFTLVELLVVISIIALLLSVLMPALNRARKAGKRVVCGSNLRSIGLMFAVYAEDYKGKLPPGTSSHYRYWDGQYLEVTSAYYGQQKPPFANSIFPNYIKNPKILYCPSNKYFNVDNDWYKNDIWKGWGASMAYMFYQSPSENTQSRVGEIINNNVAKSNFLLSMDISVGKQPNYLAVTKSMSGHLDGKGNVEGANALYAGNHVVWYPANQMSYGIMRVYLEPNPPR